MDILVCMKQILDPDVPARDFRIDPERQAAVRGNADLVANIFCENALETALQLRDAAGGSVTVLSYGTEETEDVLRKALAMKADRAVRVEQEGPEHPDALAVARVLAAAARELGGFDVVLTGRESGDWGVGQTGGLLAEELGLPFVALVDHMERTAEGLRLRRQTDTGFEVLEAGGAVVVSITNCDDNLPRIPKTRDVMKSYKLPLTTLGLSDLGLSELASAEAGASYYEVAALDVPEKNVRCEMVDDVDAFAARVAEALNAG